MKAQFVYENLDEGKFGRAVAGAALGTALAFGSPQVGQAQEPTPTEQTQNQEVIEILPGIIYGEAQFDTKQKIKDDKKGSGKFQADIGGYSLENIKPIGEWVKSATKDYGVTRGLLYSEGYGGIFSGRKEAVSGADLIYAEKQIKEDLISRGYKIIYERPDLEQMTKYLGEKGISFIGEKDDRIAIFLFTSGTYKNTYWFNWSLLLTIDDFLKNKKDFEKTLKYNLPSIPGITQQDKGIF